MKPSLRYTELPQFVQTVQIGAVQNRQRDFIASLVQREVAKISGF